jgi:DNA gyrase/topoisomerase IV subunit B
LWVFVNALIENPNFDSQTKETLKTTQAKFGSKCELSDKFVKEVRRLRDCMCFRCEICFRVLNLLTS